MASCADNETRCQKPTVFCQAAYEQRMVERLHPNAITELDIARECWESSIAGQHFSEYIQQLGILPFQVMFYTEQQLQLYVRAYQTTNAVVHLDATGSVIANIPGQKRPLYYCMLLHDGSSLKSSYQVDKVTIFSDGCAAQGGERE